MRSSEFHGLLVLDKPGGMTSRDAVNRAQGWFPRGVRLGHTGTLDPLATGVLVLCVGSATRLAEYVQQMDKVYRAELRLGARSDTDDADGTIEPVQAKHPPDRATIDASLQPFIGEIEQVPPAYSAAKVTGRRAYDLARQGADLSLQPRCVQVYGIDVGDYDYPRLELEIHCGRGVYIRSLARDLGDLLGCGALVTALRRTRVGPFTDTQALSLDSDVVTTRSALLPLSAAVAELPRVTLPADCINRLRQGQSVPIEAENVPQKPGEQDIAVFALPGELVAVARLDPASLQLKPAKVLPVQQAP